MNLKKIIIRFRWYCKKWFPKVFFKPKMTINEVSLFHKILSPTSNILEFGSGGSTIVILTAQKQLFSVESNIRFYNFMLSIKMLKKKIGTNFTYVFVDVGPTDMWGRPLSRIKFDTWGDYYVRIWDSIHQKNVQLDLIVVDGRFRVASTLYSIKQALNFNWDPKFLIHDFHRKEYHVLLQFLQIISHCESLFCFRVRKELNIVALERTLLEYRNISD